MTDNTLLRRLDAEESGVRSRLGRLRSEVTQLEEELAHLAITRRTVAKLLTDGESAAGLHEAPQEQSTRQAEEGPPDAVDTQADEDVSRLRAVSPDERQAEEALSHPAGPRPLGPVRAKIRVLVVSADRPMTAKDVTHALGRDSEKRTRVESVRAALEKLAVNGHLVKVGPGLFSGRQELREGAA